MEAKDPASGASYYYNESTGKSQWERPVETSSATGKRQLERPAETSSSVPTPPSLSEDWIEAVDETSGILDCNIIP